VELETILGAAGLEHEKALCLLSATHAKSLEGAVTAAEEAQLSRDKEQKTEMSRLNDSLGSLQEANTALDSQKRVLEGDVTWHEEANVVLSSEVSSQKTIIKELEISLKKTAEEMQQLEASFSARTDELEQAREKLESSDPLPPRSRGLQKQNWKLYVCSCPLLSPSWSPRKVKTAP
jgi:chromosome segregation ATPase